MINKKKFFDEYRTKLDQKITQQEVDAIDLFIDMVNCQFDYFSVFEWAYVFATVFQETAQTFAPVIEAFWKSEEWRKRNFRYYPYYGRGYVQITWEANYKKYSKKTKVDLVKFPDKALDPKLSFFILIDGLKFGEFTGKSLTSFQTCNYTDRMKFVNMRRCVNGTDKAELIADYAQEFLRILKIATQ
jgi:hypothetical protein